MATRKATPKTKSKTGKKASAKSTTKTKTSKSSPKAAAKKKSKPAKGNKEDSAITAEETAKIVDLACRMVGAQIQSASTEAGEACQDRLLEYFSLGYMFGMFCSILASYGKSSEEERVTILSEIYKNLFGEDGTDLLEESIELQDSEFFHKGGELGWSELQEASRTREAPDSLKKFLMADGKTL